MIIDLNLLKKQKSTLTSVIYNNKKITPSAVEDLEGILGLLDHIQDEVEAGNIDRYDKTTE